MIRTLRAIVTYPAVKRAQRKAEEAEYIAWFARLARTPARF